MSVMTSRAKSRVGSSAARAVYGLITIITVALSFSVFAQSEPARERLTAQSRGGWVCNAYGYFNRRWQTVSGPRKRTRKDAEKSAMLDCSEKLTACRLSGCWQD